MTLIASKQKTEYRWRVGDLITALEAARICGYKSAKQFQDPVRRSGFGYEFTVIWQGGRMFFLRSEVDEYLTQTVEAARAIDEKRRRDLRIRT
jgi:hypothetical protein